MSVTVIQFPHSPYCIPITRALGACGVGFDVENIPNGDRRRVIEVTGGEYYAVPVLVNGDDVVYESGGDSQDVARYVDRVFAGGRLFPDEHEGMQAILLPYLENEVEGLTFKMNDAFRLPLIDDVVERTMIIRHKERKFGAGCVDAWRRDAAAIRGQVNEHLGRFDSILRRRPFLLADVPVYADFVLYGVIGNYTYEGANGIDDKQVALASWRERMRDWSYE